MAAYYADLDDLKLRLKGAYAGLTDRTGGVVADDVVGQELLDGSHGTLNTYIGGRYAVPVDVSSDATLAQSLKRYVLDIAEYAAWAENPTREEIPKRVADKFAATVKILEAIRDGKSPLAGAEPIAEATATANTAVVVGSKRVFGDQSMKGLL